VSSRRSISLEKLAFERWNSRALKTDGRNLFRGRNCPQHPARSSPRESDHDKEMYSACVRLAADLPRRDSASSKSGKVPARSRAKLSHVRSMERGRDVERRAGASSERRERKLI